MGIRYMISESREVTAIAICHYGRGSLLGNFRRVTLQGSLWKHPETLNMKTCQRETKNFD